MDNSSKPTRRTLITGIAAASAAAGLGISTSGRASAATTGARTPEPLPTVVFVHGAFADSSGWTGAIEKLRERGYPTLAVANPLRALGSDAAYVSAVLASVTGPIVLVGHSYGGAVITNAATGNPNVKALVYVAAFAPDEGENAFQLSAGGSLPDVVSAVQVPVPGGGTDTELSIRPEEFNKAFITEVDASTALTLAATQRPATLTAFGSPSGAPAWKDIPSWFVISGADQAIPPASQRTMANRAGSRIVEIPGASHGFFIARPRVVVDVVEAAARGR
jgi:pimeloyl-ACP methyl ester carboxylesterase